MTLEEIKAKYPGLYQAIFDEGKKTGLADGVAQGEAAGIEKGKALVADAARTEGADAERRRIQGVEAQVIPGHEKLIETLKFDGKTTPEQAAVAVLQAEKNLRQDVLQKLADDAVPPVATVTPPDVEGKQDFETLVAAYQHTNKVSRAKAVSAVAKAYPKEHAAYLAKINK